jgi:cytochrome c1
MKKILVFILFFAFACCKSPYFTPVQTDADKMQGRWADFSMDNLNKGFHLYVNKCAGCHTLYKPSLYTEEQWTSVMPEMAQRAQINAEEQQAIIRYIFALREPSALKDKK